MTAPGSPANPLLEIVHLEEAARAARTRQELGFVIVNETHRLIGYRQAFLCQREGKRFSVAAISGLAQLDRTSPFHDWLQVLLAELTGWLDDAPSQEFSADTFSEAVRQGWSEWLPPHLSAICLPQPEQGCNLLLLLARDEALPAATGLEVLARAFGHAWWALASSRPLAQRVAAAFAARSRRLALGVAALLAGALFMPVRQSSVGQAEVAPLQYTVLSAPLDGVIAAIAVKPNESVKAGDVLFRLDDTSLRSRLETARRSMGVVRSEAFLSRQKAFSDVQARSEVATQEARITEKGSSISYLATMMEKVTVRAPHPGVVLFGDASDWEGKPVSLGERIMTLADSRSAGVTVWLPVADALDLEKGAEVRLFLHTDPLHPRTARTIRSSYLPVLAPDGTAAYRLTAEFVGQAELPRLGLRGTAKVYGSRVPLAYYLFRRPLAKVRQWLGV